MKNPMTPAAIEPATFRFATQHLKHCATAVPYIYIYMVITNDCRGHTQYTPDATPCDFFLWGYVKDQVYVPPLPASILELKVRIRTTTETITADILQTVWDELDYVIDVCRITKGAHTEHL